MRYFIFFLVLIFHLSTLLCLGADQGSSSSPIASKCQLQSPKQHQELPLSSSANLIADEDDTTESAEDDFFPSSPFSTALPSYCAALAIYNSKQGLAIEPIQSQRQSKIELFLWIHRFLI